MKKMEIYEPAMCCPTGLCGVSVDKELLRISTVAGNLEKKGFQIERFNLANNPEKFVENKKVNAYMADNGIKSLPLTLIEGEIIKTSCYPTNEEIALGLEVDITSLEEAKTDSEGCCQGSGCC
jgi:hypothetical protein